MNTRVTITHAGCALVLVSAAAAPTIADDRSRDQDVEALRLEVRELRERVERLEGRMSEGLPVNRAKKVEPVAGGWRVASNWQLLFDGMEERDLLDILGDPQRRKTVKKFQFWIYGDGEVRLYMRRVSSWRLPSDLEDR
jgi:hypothetical protein